ncbi:MAG: phage integrase SAM-like domain-containing protein [Bacteriovoracia bacterium]
MATVALYLRKRALRTGLFPVLIRITKNRKTSIITTDCHLLLKDWDEDKQKVKKSHPNSVRLNNYLLTKRTEAENVNFEIEKKEKVVSAKTIQEHVKAPMQGKSFFAFADEYLENLKTAGNYNVYTSEKPRINCFRSFLKRDISFQEITPAILEAFEAYLLGEKKITKRTISNYMILIRLLFNKAIATKPQIVGIEYYPFGKGKIKISIPESTKIGCTEDEVAIIENLDLDPESLDNHARNLWLFSFYLAGMRGSDVLLTNVNDLIDGRLFYTMGKNEKPGSLKLPEKALAIAKWYMGRGINKNNLLFPLLNHVQDFSNKYDLQRKIKHTIKRIDQALERIRVKAEIKKKLSFHISRHTFGNISGDKIPPRLLQKLYRHSSISTTMIYQQSFMYKDADEALEKVLNC